MVLYFRFAPRLKKPKCFLRYGHEKVFLARSVLVVLNTTNKNESSSYHSLLFRFSCCTPWCDTCSTCGHKAPRTEYPPTRVAREEGPSFRFGLAPKNANVGHLSIPSTSRHTKKGLPQRTIPVTATKDGGKATVVVVVVVFVGTKRVASEGN